MEKKNVWVVGHKNPDTDSICAAITYAYLKNCLEKGKASRKEHITYQPKRAGAISSETRFVLDYFKVEEPELVTDAGTQIKDLHIRRTEGISRQMSTQKAWQLMNILDVATLPVVNESNKLEGVIITADIARSYMGSLDNTVLSDAKTRYRNIVESLKGKLMSGDEDAYFSKGHVIVGVGYEETLAAIVRQNDMVLTGDRDDVQMLAIEGGCSCIIVTNGEEIMPEVVEEARVNGVVVIVTPYDTFTASRLLTQSIPIGYFMTRDNLVTFQEDDFIMDVRDVMSKIRHRDFPVVNSSGKYVGMFSRRNLMNMQRKKVILVDHNEASQAVDNIEQAEILEIIDHHRLGSLETMGPVYFRNQPVGCSSTIITQLYKENGVEIIPQMAGLLCAAILSDTLVFRSPTCTDLDKKTAEELASIAGIEIEKFAEDMFRAGSNFESKTEEEILNQDFKIFHAENKSFGVSQISALSKSELEKVRARILPRLEEERSSKGLDYMYVMLTDIFSKITLLLCQGEGALETAEEAFGQTAADKGLILRGVVSRKKQMVPNIIKAIDEN